MSTNIFVIWVHQLETTSMYRDYLVNLPEGLNNPYLLLLIFLGFGVYLSFRIADCIATLLLKYIKRRRLKDREQKQEIHKEEKTTAPEIPKKKRIEPLQTRQPERAYKPVSNAELFKSERHDIREIQAETETVIEEDPSTEGIDYEPILEKKRRDAKPQDEANGLDDIMANIENKRKNEQQLRSYEERNNATKQRNIEILDRSVKKNLRVEKKE